MQEHFKEVIPFVKKKTNQLRTGIMTQVRKVYRKKPSAQFHPGIYTLAWMIMPFFKDDDTPDSFDNYEEEEHVLTLRPEIFDELNIALNHYLHVIATEMNNGGTVNSAIKKMFKTSSNQVELMLASIKKTHSNAKGTVIDDIPSLTPIEIHGKSYPRSDFRVSEIDPKEVKRVLKSFNFTDSKILHISVALSYLAAEIMMTGSDRGKFRTREHVKQAAVTLFNSGKCQSHLYR
jgi:hypothetical protein